MEAAVPSDPLELTKELYAALNERDFDAVMRCFDPLAVWDVSRWGLGTHTGAGPIERFLRDWFGSLDRYEVQVQELSGLGSGVVFVVVLQIGRQTRSRGTLRVRSAPVYLWQDARIRTLTVYRDIEEGRSAAVRASRSAVQLVLAAHSEIVEAIGAGATLEHMLAPGFQIENRAAAATDHTYYGVAGVREWASDILEVFADGARYRIEEVLAAAESYVVATFSVIGRGAASGEPLEFHWAGVTWFRDGRATRAIGYASPTEALASIVPDD